ncbi:MAG: ABC transporter permease [Spirochaetales bacterium]|nr:ABC transporter permease [Spirochaetales bacterium]
MRSRAFQRTEFYLLLVIIVFSTVITIINPSFLTIENMFDLVKSSSGMAILAMGVFVVLLSGGIDVSFTAIAIAGQYIAVNTLIATGIDNLLLAFVVSCSVGMALGAINAVFISLLNLPTLITTLGTLSLFHGALLEFVGTKSINTGGLPECFKTFSALNILSFTRADGTTYGLSVFVLFFIAVVLISWVILRFTVLGRGIYAIGGNFTAAKRSGLNIHLIQFFIYMYVGFLAGIMGIMHLSLIRYSNPNYIVGTELSVIAAVVIGGARITGGTGSIIGTILGVVMIVILEKNLVLIGLSSYWQQFFIGLIIIVGVSVTYIQNRIRSQRSALTTAGT